MSILIFKRRGPADPKHGFSPMSTAARTTPGSLWPTSTSGAEWPSKGAWLGLGELLAVRPYFLKGLHVLAHQFWNVGREIRQRDRRAVRPLRAGELRDGGFVRPPLTLRIKKSRAAHQLLTAKASSEIKNDNVAKADSLQRAG